MDRGLAISDKEDERIFGHEVGNAFLLIAFSSSSSSHLAVVFLLSVRGLQRSFIALLAVGTRSSDVF